MCKCENRQALSQITRCCNHSPICPVSSCTWGSSLGCEFLGWWYRLKQHKIPNPQASIIFVRSRNSYSSRRTLPHSSTSFIAWLSEKNWTPMTSFSKRFVSNFSRRARANMAATRALFAGKKSFHKISRENILKLNYIAM